MISHDDLKQLERLYGKYEALCTKEQGIKAYGEVNEERLEALEGERRELSAQTVNLLRAIATDVETTINRRKMAPERLNASINDLLDEDIAKAEVLAGARWPLQEMARDGAADIRTRFLAALLWRLVHDGMSADFEAAKGEESLVTAFKQVGQLNV